MADSHRLGEALTADSAANAPVFGLVIGDESGDGSREVAGIVERGLLGMERHDFANE